MDATSALTRQLELDPQALEGVASAYRYKVTIKNEALIGATFCFAENLDIFSFSQVDKKRALKKEEWPVSSSLDVPNRYNVNLHLMAGNTEISQCDGCASWKDKTRRPFLVLTPTGDRVLQYLKHPFILLIFRCCPKFHSCSKQFRLVITVTSPITGETFRNEVNIYRKKMVSNKKRKLAPSSVEEPSMPMSPVALKPSSSSSVLPRETPMEAILPVFPYTKSFTPVVSPQMMYQILYSDKSESKKQAFGTETTRVHSIPLLHPIKLEPQTSKPFWNLDAHPNSIPTTSKEINTFVKGEEITDEKWLDSVFTDLTTEAPCIPTTLDDISVLLELPNYGMEIPPFPFAY